MYRNIIDFCVLIFLQSSIEPIQWDFYLHCYVFQLYNFLLVLLYFSYLFAEILYFFICFQSVCSCFLKHFYVCCFKILSDNFNLWVISVLTSINCLFLFKLGLSWFLVWWEIFYCTLDTLGLMLGDPGSYLTFLFYFLFLSRQCLHLVVVCRSRVDVDVLALCWALLILPGKVKYWLTLPHCRCGGG